jgi:hypothetical protein
MASIRDGILVALVARLATIPGWSAQLRGVENIGNVPILAVVYPISEDKQLATNEDYQCTLNVGVWITIRIEDASLTLDGGNSFRYLDRCVTEAEKKIHDPDAWGLEPGFTDVLINGHDVDEVDGDETALDAFLRLTFKYRHHYQDPAL